MFGELERHNITRITSLLNNHEADEIALVLAQSAPLAQITAWRGEQKTFAINFATTEPRRTVADFKLLILDCWPKCSTRPINDAIFANHHQPLPLGRANLGFQIPESDEASLCGECRYLFQSDKDMGYYLLPLSGKAFKNITHSSLLN